MKIAMLILAIIAVAVIGSAMKLVAPTPLPSSTSAPVSVAPAQASPTPPAAAPTPAPAPVVNDYTPVDAARLSYAYNENEVRADGLYKNQRLSITGRVSRVTRTAGGLPVVELFGSDTYGVRVIKCVFSRENEGDLQSFRTNRRVRVMGVCAGKELGDVIIAASDVN
jgi:hypothetical protein